MVRGTASQLLSWCRDITTDDSATSGGPGRRCRGGGAGERHERQRADHRIAGRRNPTGPGRQGVHRSRPETARARSGAHRAPGEVTPSLAECLWLAEQVTDTAAEVLLKVSGAPSPTPPCTPLRPAMATRTSTPTSQIRPPYSHAG